MLHDTLDRSLSLAASMEVRGYGRREALTPRDRALATTLSLFGAFLICIGLYGTMQGRGVGGVVGDVPAWTTLPVLLVGLVISAIGVTLTGRMMKRTRYRRDPWGLVEWGVCLCGLIAVCGVRWVFAHYPNAVSTNTEPLSMPEIPLLLPFVALPAVLPAFFTPVPQRAVRHAPPKRRPESASGTNDAMILRGSHD